MSSEKEEVEKQILTEICKQQIWRRHVPEKHACKSIKIVLLIQKYILLVGFY